MMSTREPSLINWRRSRRSSETGDNCVEVAALDGVIAVRDSKNTVQPPLSFEPNAWGAFVRRVKNT